MLETMKTCGSNPAGFCFLSRIFLLFHAIVGLFFLALFPLHGMFLKVQFFFSKFLKATSGSN